MNRFTRALPGLLLAGSALALPSTASAAGAPACTNADLHVTLHPKGAAAGSAYVALRYTNVGDHACRTGGFGGLSLVGHGDGTQLGSPATRAAGTPVRSFVLRPGERATSLAQIADALNFPKRECHPTRADGFRVYVPNARASQFVAYRTLACAKPLGGGDGGFQLSHRALRKVR
ncbi:DUF4232 domain-containing protein [Nocardioides nematodiphilus]|uniref:DUF4232 domain-containing protein n=1 Tax=Nocardioides nematodiphilus TaxID=2849669 RepID=UPI001CD95788|nr:DUF4232 domain-containing protein [Nocardioides nematodiphilus]MCA1984310.1 DUF4232 domain-containing protein [Nocardioides nematodiphilus]